MKRKALSRAHHLFFLLTFTGGVFVALAATAVADGRSVREGEAPRPAVMVPPERIDTRLPPVLPGQSVTTQDGRKHKVISTAGPVPVNPTVQAPPAPVAPGVPQVAVPTAPISVIVDRREK